MSKTKHPSDNRVYESPVQLKGDNTSYRIEVVKNGRKYVGVVLKTIDSTPTCKTIDEAASFAKQIVASAMQYDQIESFMTGK